MNQKHHPLSDWLETAGERRSDFARRIEASESHLSLILAGKRGVSRDLAARIQAVTGIDARVIMDIPTDPPPEARQ